MAITGWAGAGKGGRTAADQPSRLLPAIRTGSRMLSFESRKMLEILGIVYISVKKNSRFYSLPIYFSFFQKKLPPCPLPLPCPFLPTLILPHIVSGYGNSWCNTPPCIIVCPTHFVPYLVTCYQPRETSVIAQCRKTRVTP